MRGGNAVCATILPQSGDTANVGAWTYPALWLRALELLHAATVEHFGLPGFSGQGTIRARLGCPAPSSGHDPFQNEAAPGTSGDA
jgi:hypothetical protein